MLDDPDKFWQTVFEAVRRANVRAVVSRGWSTRSEGGRFPDLMGLGPLAQEHLEKHVLEIDQAPHDLIFPRVDAVLHHGGAGTTAAVLRAMKPSVIKPFFGDQFFWAEQVEKVGTFALTSPIHQ